MKLQHFTLEADDIRLTQEVTTAVGSVGDRSGLVLTLDATDGISGRGGTAPLPGATQRLDDLAAEIEEWANEQTDHDVVEAIESLPETLTPAARFAIHTALIDIQACAAGVPLAQFLRSGAPMTVPSNALVTAETPREVYQACVSAVSEGFTSVKLKVAASEPGTDATRIIAASEACGTHAQLRLDANCGWSLDEAVHVIGRVGKHRLEYVEDPVGNVEDYSSFSDRTGVPAAVDVPASWANSLASSIEASKCRFVVMKPAAVGGVDRLLRTAVDLGADVTTVVSSSIDGPVALAAAVHVAAAVPVATAHGLATGPLVAGVPEHLHPIRGSIELSASPGVEPT